jgi:hypothetical protein
MNLALYVLALIGIIELESTRLKIEWSALRFTVCNCTLLQLLSLPSYLPQKVSELLLALIECIHEIKQDSRRRLYCTVPTIRTKFRWSGSKNIQCTVEYKAVGVTTQNGPIGTDF